jgi:hypothetical protein
MMVFAYTISTDQKIGNSITTSLDKERHEILSAQMIREMGQEALGPEYSLEGKSIIQQFLRNNGLMLNSEEREGLYQNHLERVGKSQDEFEGYLFSQGLSKEAFIDEIAYQQEISRWMYRTYGWRETVSQDELDTFKRDLMQDLWPRFGRVSYEVIKIADASELPVKGDAAFWTKHSDEVISYTDKGLDQIPDPYESFILNQKKGAYSKPIEAFGEWHLIHLVDKQAPTLPADEVLEHHLMDKKCKAHLGPWITEQLKYAHKSK